jgi:hypothetical protein
MNIRESEVIMAYIELPSGGTEGNHEESVWTASHKAEI